MKRGPALLTVLAIGVLAALVAWFLHAYVRTTEWIDLPRTGEAATNPLFGLRVALEKDGRHVRGGYRLDPAALRLTPADTVVYDGDPRGLPLRTRTALLDWLRRGGHLVIATPAVDAASDSFTAGDQGPLPVPLLDAIGVHVRRGPGHCLDDAAGLAFAFCSGRRFEAPATALVRIGDANGNVYARVPVGRGRVDVVNSFEMLATDALRDSGNRRFVAQLIADRDGRPGTIHVLHSTDVPSLWGLLVRQGWPVWGPLMLALAGWLVARMRRFGPLLPTPALERRSLLEHVAASGQHQWRFGRGDALHAALLDAFFARLRRRDPQAAALQGHPQVMRLVERTGLPEAQIVDALTPPDPRDAKALVARIATLVRMRNRL